MQNQANRDGENREYVLTEQPVLLVRHPVAAVLGRSLHKTRENQVPFSASYKPGGVDGVLASAKRHGIYPLRMASA